MYILISCPTLLIHHLCSSLSLPPFILLISRPLPPTHTPSLSISLSSPFHIFPPLPHSHSPSLPLSRSLYYQPSFSPSTSPSLFHSLTLPLCATLWLFSTLSLYILLPHSRHPSLSPCLPISPLICHPLSLSHTHSYSSLHERIRL
jgi:hypothetical protein